jgi:branched-chain amino acid transport system substrate-binding protein
MPIQFPARGLVFAVGAALASFVLSGLAAHPAIAQSDVVRIGIVSPNTGAAARYGAFAWRGAQLARDEINAAGGINGKKIELFQGDSQCIPTEGVSSVQRMIAQDKVRFVIGDVCSSVTIAMQPVVENAGVLLINAASSNPDITYKAGVGGYKWSFRNYPTDENRASIVLKYATEEKKIKKFAVLSVDSDYGRGAITLTKKYLGDFGAEIVSEDYYKDKEADFRPVLANIRRSGAGAIIMYGLSDTTPIIARQMVEAGLAGKVILIGSAEFNNPEAIKIAPTALNGAVEAAAYMPEWDTPKNLEFVAAYRNAYAGETPNVHAYAYWETLRLVAAAAKVANSDNQDDIRQALSTMTYEGVMGKVTFDDHNQANLPMILFEIIGGKPVIKGTFNTQIKYSAR